MSMKENNKYRYTDTAERNIRMNQFYIIASSLLAIVFLFYQSQHCAHCYVCKYHSDRRFLCDKCRNAPSK